LPAQAPGRGGQCIWADGVSKDHELNVDGLEA
jgi:hypothetical protein